MKQMGSRGDIYVAFARKFSGKKISAFTLSLPPEHISVKFRTLNLHHIYFSCKAAQIHFFIQCKKIARHVSTRGFKAGFGSDSKAFDFITSASGVLSHLLISARNTTTNRY